MSTFILTEQKEHALFITLNRTDKHNAFNQSMMIEITTHLQAAEDNPNIRVIALRAHGPHFCAGADLEWMSSMIHHSQTENEADALILAKMLKTLHQSSKPTFVIVQGGAFGGGAGLVAASDIAFASTQARFCFSEIKLGLLPAVISPYVLKAIGLRTATWLFLSAQMINAHEALRLGLIQAIFDEPNFFETTEKEVLRLAAQAPEAIAQLKPFLQSIKNHPIDDRLSQKTASWIAHKRVSEEGQKGMSAFLNKTPISWN